MAYTVLALHCRGGLLSALKLSLKHVRNLRIEITEMTVIHSSRSVVGTAVLEICARLGFYAA